MIGMNINTLIDKGLAFVNRKLEVSYINEALLGEVLKIKTIPYGMGRSSFTVKQVIYNQHDQVITEAISVNVMIDFEKRKSIPLVEDIAKRFREFREE